MRKKLNQINNAIRSYGIKSSLRSIASIIISDVVIVSFRKTGKTWLRLMIAKAIAEQYKIKKINLNTEFMTVFKKCPNVMFSHAGTTKKKNNLDFRKIFKDKKIIFLSRDPRAMMPSLFHDYTKRERSFKGNISEFIRDPYIGVKSVIDSMNGWADILKKGDKALTITYEDLFINTNEELEKIFSFIGINIDPENIKKAVNYGSKDNMREMEKSGEFKDTRMIPVDKKDINTFKARKCKLGSFQEELSPEDIKYINEQIKKNLNPFFSYDNYDYVNMVEK